MQRECEVKYGEVPKIRKLSGMLKRPVVVFDIEHTGYVDGVVGVTEFAAIVFNENGEVERVNTLVNPGMERFNQYSMRVSRLSPKMLRRAPSYGKAVGGFVGKHKESLWVGFNSNSSDVPVLRKEHARLGIDDHGFLHRLDVMKLSNHLGFSGSLSGVVGGIDNKYLLDAHVAMADASMTAFLLERLLTGSTVRQLREFGVLPKAASAEANQNAG